jgi:hypothetical protein
MLFSVTQHIFTIVRPLCHNHSCLWVGRFWMFYGERITYVSPFANKRKNILNEILEFVRFLYVAKFHPVLSTKQRSGACEQRISYLWILGGRMVYLKKKTNIKESYQMTIMALNECVGACWLAKADAGHMLGVVILSGGHMLFVACLVLYLFCAMIIILYTYRVLIKFWMSLAVLYIDEYISPIITGLKNNKCRVKTVIKQMQDGTAWW